MSYQQESIYLNQLKDLHSIKYKDVGDHHKKITDGKFSKIEENAEEPDLASNTILFFQEKEIILRDVKNVCLYFQNQVLKSKQPSIPFKDIVTRINFILHRYIEKPSLLDNIVEPVLSQIIEALRIYLSNYFQEYQEKSIISSLIENINEIISIVIMLITVRGANNVQKYLGHETSDFEPLLFFLISSDHRATWETKHFLFLWLSVVLFIPFEFNRLDSQVISKYYSQTFKAPFFNKIESLIIDFCKKSMYCSSRIGDAIGKCIAVIFRRPDMCSLEQFKELLYWGVDELKDVLSSNEKLFYAINIYKILNQMVKNIRRDFIVEILKEFFEKLILLDHSILEQQKIFLIEEPANLKQQRLKLFLNLNDKLLLESSKRRVYRTFKKDLQDQLEFEDSVPMITNTKEINQLKKQTTDQNRLHINTDSHNLQFIQVVEKTMDYLFEGLKHKNSEVRYESAKSIAQIAYKLPENLSDEILQTVLDMYSQSDEFLAHSICLLIGEFCRKRILTPFFLPKVFVVLNNSLLFEDVEGLSSSGSIVRDAACFISWSLAKFYEKETLAPFVDELARNLLLTALLDKEGMCRRGAAASFQENVGRQGYFPHGIEIISEMDYFTVGIRQNSFLTIAPFVASFSEYTSKFIDHLSNVKLFHFDKQTRVLSAKTLAIISLLDPQQITKKTIPLLIQKVKEGNLYERHGAIHALGYILIAFSGQLDVLKRQIEEENNIFLKSLKINEQKLIQPGVYMEKFKQEFEKTKNKNILHLLDKQVLKEIIDIPHYIVSNGLLKGLGGEIQRIALSQLVLGVSLAKIPLEQETIHQYFDFVEEAFKTTIIEIHEYVNVALEEFAQQYLSQNPEQFVKFIDKFLHRIQSEKIKDIKKSFCLGISSFPVKLLELKKKEVLEALRVNCLKNKKIPMNDPEIRKICVYSLGKIVQNFMKFGKDTQSFQIFFKTNLKTILDFTLDKRGDIGLIIREQTIESVFDLMTVILDQNLGDIYDETTLINQLGWILSLLVEPNDKIRMKAGYIMQIVVNKYFDKLINFEGKKELTDIFDNKNLREKFQNYQEKYFQKYDVSLMDNKKFLQYQENEQFVYFWNISRCVYSLVLPLSALKRFSGNILRGFILSLNSKTEEIQREALVAVKDFLEKHPEQQKPFLEAIYKIFSKNKKKEKFFEASLNAISVLLKLELVNFEDQEIFESIIKESHEACAKTDSLNKLRVCSQIVTFLLEKVPLDWDIFQQKYRKVVEMLMFSDFPLIRKEFFENFYLFLISAGNLLFSEEEVDEMSEIISNIDISEEGEQHYYLFKNIWEERMNK